MKKKQVMNWAIEDRKVINEKAIEVITDNIVNNLNNVFKSLELLNDINIEQSIILDKDLTNSAENFINIDNYTENEIISFSTNLIPSNYYSLETYSVHSSFKNIIKNSIYSKLSKVKKLNKWKCAICICQLNSGSRKSDLDNYFFKPYIDALVLSGFLENDYSQNLRLIYAPLTSNNKIIKITLINKNKIEKYFDLIKSVL